MKIKKLILLSVMLLVATVGFTTEPSKSSPAVQQSEATQSVQGDVDKASTDKADVKRSHIYKEAITVIEETKKALVALSKEKPDKQAALKALENSTGKIEIILAREPDLAFATIDVSVETYDFLSSIDTIKAMIHDVENFLDEGEVQKARVIMNNLVNEIDINTTSIPLVSYPLATTIAADLIEKNKIDEAIEVLKTQLTTLVVSKEIIPLSILRAQMLLTKAEEKALAKERSEEQQNELENLLDEARTQLQKGKLLGYGSQDDYKSIYKEIDKLEELALQNKSGKGKGWFDAIKEKVGNLL